MSTVAGHRLSLVSPEAQKRVWSSYALWPSRADVDSVAPPPTESLHTMPRGKQPLVIGQRIHVCGEAAFVERAA